MKKKHLIIIILFLSLFFLLVLVKSCKKVGVMDPDYGTKVIIEEEKRNYDLMACKKTEDSIKEELEALNTCSNSDDCVLVNGCPYGCNQLINKDSNQSKLSELARNYIDNCPDCDYECRAAIREGDIKCVEGKCIGK